MIPRRGLLAGFAGLSGLSLAGCGSRQAPNTAHAPPGDGTWTPKAGGLDAIIEYYNVWAAATTVPKRTGTTAPTPFMPASFV